MHSPAAGLSLRPTMGAVLGFGIITLFLIGTGWFLIKDANDTSRSSSGDES
jgi:hypothetical protein